VQILEKSFLSRPLLKKARNRDGPNGVPFSHTVVDNIYGDNTMQDEKVKTEKDLRHQLRGQLLQNCGLSVAAFARKHGYKPKTVDRVIARYWSNDKNPRGVMSQEILKRLNDEISSQ
jgi:hypothetical protein